jgi:hypothetical protein
MISDASWIIAQYGGSDQADAMNFRKLEGLFLAAKAG